MLATDLGAQGERVRAHGGGFLLPADDPAAALAAILGAADDPAAYAEQTALATLNGIPTVADMTERYADLYRDVLDRRRAFAAPAQARGEPLARGLWRAVVVVPPGSHGGYARVLAPVCHPEVQWKLRVRSRADRSPPDVAIVHGAAVGREWLDRLLRDRVPLVLDLDEGSGLEPGAAPPEELRRLLDAAALTLVATPAMAAAAEPHARRVAVHPTALDERLFPLGAPGAGATPSGGDGPALRALCSCPPADPGWIARLEIAGAEIPVDVLGPQPDYPAHVRALRAAAASAQVALAPAGTPELTLLEYAALGLPVVGPDLDEDPDARRQRAERARADLLAGRLLHQRAGELLEAIGSVLEAGPTLPRETRED